MRSISRSCWAKPMSFHRIGRSSPPASRVSGLKACPFHAATISPLDEQTFYANGAWTTGLVTAASLLALLGPETIKDEECGP